MEAHLEEYYEKHQKSLAAWEKASKVIPCGTGSNIRAYAPFPFFVKESKGSKVWDIDGNEYIDCQIAMGPIMVGHANPILINAVKDQIEKGTMYAMPHEKTYVAIQELQKRYPAMEMVRFANSGAEATMHSLRVARGYTGKEKIIKLEGGYHGAQDYALFSIHPDKGKMGPARLPSLVPESEGVPKAVGESVIIVPFNNIEALKYAIRKYEGEIAAFILEPVMANSSVILPEEGYLEEVRKITQEEGIVLIFDEVITGCRVSYGGATEYYNVSPDLICLSKAIGGGYSIAAFGGKSEVMGVIEGKVAHYGTHNANPLGITALLTTLRDILTPETTQSLIDKTSYMFEEMSKIVKKTGVQAKLVNIGAMGGVAFSTKDVKDYRSWLYHNEKVWHKFFITMLNKGVIMIGADATETIFFSIAHTDEDYAKVLKAFEETLEDLPKS